MPEDTQVNTLGGEPQHTNGFIMSGLPQVNTIYLGGGEREGENAWRCAGNEKRWEKNKMDFTLTNDKEHFI